MTNAVLSAGDRLQLRFARRGDRWEHEVRCQIGDRVVWQLNSAEGTADDIWPQSPPFQSLEMHAHPDGRTFALLVGMAGSSHWSASIETDPVGERIIFDVACRIKTEPKWLGSSYSKPNPDRPASMLEPDAIERFPAEQPRIEAMALESTAGGLQPTVEKTVETTGERTLVRITDLAGSLPRTVRWKYAISASEPAAQAR